MKTNFIEISTLSTQQKAKISKFPEESGKFDAATVNALIFIHEKIFH
jgi:hypothetical protein